MPQGSRRWAVLALAAALLLAPAAGEDVAEPEPMPVDDAPASLAYWSNAGNDSDYGMGWGGSDGGANWSDSDGGNSSSEDVEVVTCSEDSHCGPMDVCVKIPPPGPPDNSSGPPDNSSWLPESYSSSSDYDEEIGVGICAFRLPPPCNSDEDCEEGSFCTSPESFQEPDLVDFLPPNMTGFCAVLATTCMRASDCPAGDDCASAGGPLPDGMGCPEGTDCFCVEGNAAESCVREADCADSDECWSVSTRAPVPAAGCHAWDDCVCVAPGGATTCKSHADCAAYPGDLCMSETSRAMVPASGCRPGDECICATPNNQVQSCVRDGDCDPGDKCMNADLRLPVPPTGCPNGGFCICAGQGSAAAAPSPTTASTTVATTSTTTRPPPTTLVATTTARPTTTAATTTTARTTTTATTTTRTTTTTTQDPGDCSLPNSGPGTDVSKCLSKRPPSTCVVTCADGYRATPASVTYTCSDLVNGFSGGSGPFCVSTTMTTTTRTTTSTTRPTTTTTTTLPLCVRVPSGVGINTSDCAGKVAGTRCTLSCMGAYEGDPTVLQCGSSGDFDGYAPTCTKKQCRSGLPDSGYDTSGCAGAVAGASCPVGCLPGYAPKKKFFTCLSNGTFSGELPSCVLMSCAELPSGTGVNATACTGKRSGDSCTATCKEGYTGTPVGLTCGTDGKFANSAGGAALSPTCSPKTCSAASLDAAPDLVHSCGGVQYGRSCGVSCADGYGNGFASLDCGGSGPTLSGTLPTCVAQNCTRRAPQGDGVTSDCAGKKTGETCTASCIAGYEGTGSGAVTCTSSGAFSNLALTCSRKACGNLSAVTGFEPPKVESTCASKVFRQTCSADCGDGFRRTGNASSLQCGSAGAFVTAVGGGAATPPTCRAIPCTSGAPSARGVESDCDGTATGETCTASAAQGYEYQTGTSATTLTCQASGAFKWDTQAVQVVPGRCPPASWSTGVLSSCVNKVVGQTCWAYCETGYVGTPREYECDDYLNITAIGEEVSCWRRRLGEQTETSGADAGEDWPGDAAETADAAEEEAAAPPPLRWLGAACTLASALPAGRASDCAAGTADGATCIVECAAGYSIGTGSPIVYTCSAGTFTWAGSDQYPTCTPTPCTYSLPGGLGVTSDCSGVGTGLTCTASCAAGYTGTPATTPFTCQSTGEFSGTSPTCTALACNALSLAAQFSTAACAGKTTGQTCSVACADGYTLAGSPATYTCGTDQSFTGTTPTCNANACTSGVPSGADISPEAGCSSLTTGGTCSVPCATASGYTGTAATYTCGSTGSLTGTYPTCTLQTCADLSPPNASYSHTCTSKSVGSSCTVSCAAGYQLASGSSAQTWQCAWDSSAANLQGAYPTCVGLPCTDNIPTGDTIVHNCTGVPTGSACLCSCVPGYTGDATTFTCQASGSLQGSAPTCSKSTCPAGTSTASYDASACAAVAFGDVCSVACQDGYGGTAASVTCGLDATNTTVQLGSNMPTCTAEPCIYNLPVGATFSHDCQSVVTGGTCTVSCATGYAGDPATFTCETDNTLNGTVPTCLWVTTTDADTTTTDAPLEDNATETSTTITTTTTAAAATDVVTTTTAATTSSTRAATTTAAATTTPAAAATTTTAAPIATTTRTTTASAGVSVAASTTTPATTSLIRTTTAAPTQPTTTQTGTITATSTRTRTSTTRVETTAGEQVTTIAGSMTLSVADPAAFVADPDAKAGVEAGIAKVANISAAYVNATLSLAPSGAARRLQSAGGVRVDYTIAVPASAGGALPPISSIVDSLSGIDAVAMTAAINSALDDLAPGKYGVAVTGMTAPTSDEEDTIVKVSKSPDKKHTAVVVGCVVGILGGCGCCCLVALCARRAYYGRSQRERGEPSPPPAGGGGAGNVPGEIVVEVAADDQSCN